MQPQNPPGRRRGGPVVPRNTVALELPPTDCQSRSTPSPSTPFSAEARAATGRLAYMLGPAAPEVNTSADYISLPAQWGESNELIFPSTNEVVGVARSSKAQSTAFADTYAVSQGGQAPGFSSITFDGIDSDFDESMLNPTPPAALGRQVSLHGVTSDFDESMPKLIPSTGFSNQVSISGTYRGRTTLPATGTNPITFDGIDSDFDESMLNSTPSTDFGNQVSIGGAYQTAVTLPACGNMSGSQPYLDYGGSMAPPPRPKGKQRQEDPVADTASSSGDVRVTYEYADWETNREVNEEPDPEEIPPAPLNEAQKDLLKRWRQLPYGVFLARVLFNKPDWLDHDEVMTKIHNGQVVPVAWASCTRNVDPVWSVTDYHVSGDLFTSSRNRLGYGISIANNALLRAPLMDEGLHGYKHRQGGDPIGRGNGYETIFEKEYRAWADHPDTHPSWLPSHDRKMQQARVLKRVRAKERQVQEDQ